MATTSKMPKSEINLYGPFDPDENDPPCSTCKGRGTVNPLTAPKDFLCLATTDCPRCDGTGLAP